MNEHTSKNNQYSQANFPIFPTFIYHNDLVLCKREALRELPLSLKVCGTTDRTLAGSLTLLSTRPINKFMHRLPEPPSASKTLKKGCELLPRLLPVAFGGNRTLNLKGMRRRRGRGELGMPPVDREVAAAGRRGRRIC